MGYLSDQKAIGGASDDIQGTGQQRYPFQVSPGTSRTGGEQTYPSQYPSVGPNGALQPGSGTITQNTSQYILILLNLNCFVCFIGVQQSFNPALHPSGLSNVYGIPEIPFCQ